MVVFIAAVYIINLLSVVSYQTVKSDANYLEAMLLLMLVGLGILMNKAVETIVVHL